MYRTINYRCYALSITAPYNRFGNQVSRVLGERQHEIAVTYPSCVLALVEFNRRDSLVCPNSIQCDIARYSATEAIVSAAELPFNELISGFRRCTRLWCRSTFKYALRSYFATTFAIKAYSIFGQKINSNLTTIESNLDTCRLCECELYTTMQFIVHRNRLVVCIVTYVCKRAISS